MTLIVLLKVAAILQLAVALLNLRLVRMLGWKKDIDRLPLLIREVFYIHSGFVSLTLTIFAVLTWRFADEMVTAPMSATAVWLAMAIGLFWGIRTVAQVAFYSSSHWRGKTAQTIAHITLLVMYGGMTACYGIAALK